MKIVTIVGARPQFIKASAISRLTRQFSGLEEVIVHTGQHYDDNVSAVFFRELEIPDPRYNLGIGNLTHGSMTGRQLEGIENILLEERPDAVLVYGDTNSTLAGALAAAKLHIPIAHVEAGLRSFNRRMPEELNRKLTDHLASWLFAPTEAAVNNLRREGISEATIWKVGDVMYDVALFFGTKSQSQSTILNRLELSPKQYVVSTLHRAETTDEPARLQASIDGLIRLSETMPVVMPLHPRTRKVLHDIGYLNVIGQSLKLLEPVGYLDMTNLVRNARLVVTDSGGLQKEAFFHGVVCVTLREETEWVELVSSGWNILPASLTTAGIASALIAALEQSPKAQMGPYGNGDAAREILTILHDRRD